MVWCPVKLFIYAPIDSLQIFSVQTFILERRFVVTEWWVFSVPQQGSATRFNFFQLLSKMTTVKDMSQPLRSEEGSERLRAATDKEMPPGVEVDENGLILPKKLYNPCLNNKETKDLAHQIRWNAKAGINPLEKSELAKVMGDRRHRQKELEKQKEVEAEQTPFQKMIQERAKRMERIERPDGESSEDSGHCSPEPENEFLKVHAKLKRTQQK